MTDKTVTRAELREQAWWTTDAVPAPWTSTLDDGDDDDLDEPAASVPEPLALDLGTPQFAFTVPEDLGPYEPSAPAPDDDDDDVEDAVSPWAPVSADGPAEPAAEPADEPSTDGAADTPAEYGDAADEAGHEPASPTEDPILTAAAADDEPIDAEGAESIDEPIGTETPESTDEPNDTEDPESADAPPEFVSPPAMPTGLTDIPPVPVLSGPLATFGESARPSFIEPASEHPAKLDGWRAFLAQLGIPMRPSRAAIQRAEWEMAVSRHWAGCRTIAVANGKGGVGKTMTTAVLAAVYARHGGGTVLAWDNNDTRGTLGWRTEQGDYDTTIRDLLPHASRLLETTASVSDIARYVHHQTVDRYDVLRSNPELLAADQRITTADFDLLMQVAARYYRMVIFDSGNDESADRWLRMIDSAHQLVVPTLAAPESAESAALLLDALRRRDEHSRRLADNAVVIVSQSERSNAAAVQEIAEGFVGHVRAVEVIPFDDALKAGRIRYGSLQPKTSDAWMRAAAAVADGL